MSEFIWPLAVVLISAVFFLIFREPISTLIKRTKSIGREGLDASHEDIMLARLGNDQPDTIAELRKEHLAEIERIEQRYTERNKEIIEPLQRVVSKLSKQVSDMDSRITTIETNRVIMKMLAAPPLKSDTKA